MSHDGAAGSAQKHSPHHAAAAGGWRDGVSDLRLFFLPVQPFFQQYEVKSRCNQNPAQEPELTSPSGATLMPMFQALTPLQDEMTIDPPGRVL
ncbi:uncharacterized protein [Macaca nemestrina]|uniref:uncharacterized protein isoform X13 n=1 Tax=Macaca nemestrina TaxID=9545 RepID=UPI0039B8FB9A